MTKLSLPIQIMLVDDHVLFRDGMASLLRRDGRFEIVCEANNGASALENIQKTVPEVVLMDIQMPGMGGIEAARQILSAYPDLKVIMITVSEKEHDLFEAVKAGAQGYILKTDTDSKYMCEAIVRVAAGEAIIPPAMAPRLLMEFASLAQTQPAKETDQHQTLDDSALIGKEKTTQFPGQQAEANLLTPREFQVLELVAEGLTNKGIASQLTISENTVRSHLRSIMDKLHMNSRVQAALWWQKQRSESP